MSAVGAIVWLECQGPRAPVFKRMLQGARQFGLPSCPSRREGSGCGSRCSSQRTDPTRLARQTQERTGSAGGPFLPVQAQVPLGFVRRPPHSALATQVAEYVAAAGAAHGTRAGACQARDPAANSELPRRRKLRIHHGDSSVATSLRPVPGGYMSESECEISSTSSLLNLPHPASIR